MAKKKRTKKKPTSRSKKAPTKKTGKSSGRKPAKRPAAGRKGTAKKLAAGSRAKSVDSLLKHFAKERAQSETQLLSLQKKKQELEERARKLQQQIAKMAEQERAVEAGLAQLDRKRDQEVKQLLGQLGVRLEGSGGGAQHARENDGAQSSGDGNRPGRDRVFASKANGRRD